MYMSECLLHFSMIINVILSISTSAIKIMATSIYIHHLLLQKNWRICKEHKQISFLIPVNLLRLFLLHLKRLIFIELDRIQLDFYIYQLFNNHTERLLDTVVPLNYLMSKDTSLILGVGELVSFTFFYNNQCDF